MASKALIFDSSSIITLALNNLLYILEPLKKKFGGEFYITEDIKKELIDNSMQIRRFMLEALTIKKLIDDGILKIVSSKEIEREAKRIADTANYTYKTQEEWIRVIHEGEASCLALYNTIKADKKALVIDERTTRMIIEAPDNLRKLFEKKLHTKISSKPENYSLFKDFKIIRSSELAFIAYSLKIISLPAKPKDALAALLYAQKYKGCAISWQEIDIAKAML